MASPEQGIVVKFRDSRNRIVPPSKAKRFYVYDEHGNLIIKGEFPAISWSVADKEEAVLEVLTQYYFEISERTTTSELEEAIEEVDTVEQMFLDLLNEVSKTEPKLAKQMYQEYIADKMYRDVQIEFLQEELDRRIQERLPATITVVEKEIFAKRLNVRADLEKFYFTFEKPVDWTDRDYRSLMDFISIQMKDVTRIIMDDMAQRGEDRMILRLTFDQVRNGIRKHEGIGPSRTAPRPAKDTSDLIDLLWDDLMAPQLEGKWAEYMKGLPSVQITGFTLENIFNTQ